MASETQRPKEPDNALSKLNVAIDALNLAKDVCSFAPAQAAFGVASALLTMIRDSMANEQDYVELGLNCADICGALDRGLNGKQLDDISQSVCEAIRQLTIAASDIRKKATRLSGRGHVSRLLYAKGDKEKIAAWKLELNRILLVFNTELAINTYVTTSRTNATVSSIHATTSDTNATVSSIHDNVLKIREELGGQVRSIQASMLGESPPPVPRVCFGRDDLIKTVVGLAENLNPVALIGAGGIGKTSVALTALHDCRIKQRFGDNRRFIRCDQFPASRANLLVRLSKVIGAGIENPEDLIPLRPFLSSKEMMIVLDNAESILDPLGVEGQEIYQVVEELSQFPNICLVITSRITTIPPSCETFDIPTLTMEAARDTFYRIYKHRGHSDSVDNILKQLEFHPLSITLLATVAHQNKWGGERLAREWAQRRTSVLRTEHNESLGATIELSLTSPTFKQLGHDARDLLGVIAFFPQGLNEDNLDWLFPTISDLAAILDKFCILSLTYRNDGFITMLVPLRDYLRPKDPLSSPLLCMIKESYFTRLSAKPDPLAPGSEETRWITSEDANVEHLLSVLTSIDAISDGVWRACADFMNFLCCHKPRRIVLGPKIKQLPDDHPFKPACLALLAWLFGSVGDHAEERRILDHALKLERERGGDDRIAFTLNQLSDASRLLGLYEDGICQAKEALEIYERIGDIVKQGHSLKIIAWSLLADNQLDAAEEAASRAVQLLSEEGEDFQVCKSHRLLGNIYHSKGEREKAIRHFEIALGIASRFDWNAQLLWIHYSLALLFLDEDKFDDAHARIEQAKLHAINLPYHLGYLVELQAHVYHRQCRLGDATSEATRALEIYEKLGALRDLERCRALLQDIESTANGQDTPAPTPGPPPATFANTR